MNVELACTLRARMKGLLGREEFEGVLMLAPCSDIHTFGMKFAIDVAFVDRHGMVLRAERSVPPSRRLFYRGAVATFERRANVELRWPTAGERMVFDLGPQATAPGKEERG